jgi:2-C-methyl-D-erythritol 4-phosphate cytidylyltransferase
VSVWAVLVAAGAGTRFGGHKQLTLLGDRPLWQWSLAALHDAGLDDVVVVGPVPGGIPGGPRRRDSVAVGLAQIPPSAEHVVVHDAARPLAGPELVRRVVERLLLDDADGVIPVMPVTDTLKRVEDHTVVATVDREHLMAVQTPQGFRARSLRQAHDEIEGDATDDAALIEAWGGTVVTVAGDAHNLKVTFSDDLAVAQAYQALDRDG